MKKAALCSLLCGLLCTGVFAADSATAKKEAPAVKPATTQKAAPVTKAVDPKKATSVKAADPKAAPAAKPGAKVDTLIVTARLAEIPGKFAPNDIYNYVYIMKYQVIKVEKGNYTGKEILVGEYNPLIPRAKIADKMAAVVKGNADKFTVGIKHHLVLVAPMSAVWNDQTEDEYFDSDLTKYFALQTDVAK
jgi:hypothetical protein